MSKPHVLVVDDRPNMVQLLAKVLREDATIHTAGSGTDAIKILERRPVSAVVCDLRMPDLSGIEVLRASKRLQPSAEFVLMTAHASVPTAVEAMREGAYDYITKPFDPDNLRAIVLRALSRAAIPNAEALGTAGQTAELLPGVLGTSDLMRQLADQVRRVSATDATALVLGEAGTGKERIARAIHELGRRSSKRFVNVNCAAIPAELLESEIFGHARGSFNGATSDRPGLFEEAEGGTLLLDDIGEMRLSLQAKLTRAVEQRAVRRLGESKERRVDVRLIATAHRNIEGMVHAGTFREDLWYRLSVAVVRVPPLRERREDIELLAMHFLREGAGALGAKRAAAISSGALDAFRAFSWPGNVRQLRSAVERASIEAGRGSLDVQHLPPEVTMTGSLALGNDVASKRWQEAIDLGRKEAGRHYLQAVLKKYGGRVGEAAVHAGVERESFYRLLRRYGVQPDGTSGEPEK